MGMDRDAAIDRASAIFVGLAFIFWGAVQLWSIGAALFGGAYPWPANNFLEPSTGRDWLTAVVMFVIGGMLVGLTVVVWNIVVVLPLHFLTSRRK